MGAVAVGAVVKIAVRFTLKEVAEKIPPVIFTSNPSLLGLVRSPRLDAPNVCEKALLTVLKPDVPDDVSEPPSTRKPAPLNGPQLTVPPGGISSVPPVPIFVSEPDPDKLPE